METFLAWTVVYVSGTGGGAWRVDSSPVRNGLNQDRCILRSIDRASTDVLGLNLPLFPATVIMNRHRH